MAETKTKPMTSHVDAFIAAVEKPLRRDNAMVVREMMERVTGEPATMWGPSIIGFGSYHYKYASGHEGDTCRIGFSPRSANLVFYVGTFPEFADLLDRLGKHKIGKGCLYINKLADVDLAVLEDIIRCSYNRTVP
jgi:hypothetical protein